jgi:osmoprotectant transport system substrate-binding protein
MVQTLKAAGADVTDQTGLVGTPVVRAALESGKVDAYYEYTGTGWISILKNTKPVAGSEAQFDAVKQADAKNDITWFAAAPANNTYAIAANEQVSGAYSPKTISDYARISKDNPGDAGLCTAAEFVTRDDGLPGLEKTYGFTLPKDKVATLDFGLVYASVAKGDPCKFAVVFATDGQIQSNKLTVLQDDKGFFPAYNIATTMRTSVYTAHKDAYDKLFGELNKLLTTEQMQKLNGAVDVEGREVADVVEEFLKANKVL